MGLMSTKKRESGVELLRIIAMCGVVILHFNDGRAFVDVEFGSINYYILIFAESICICAVNLYLLISGYFLCTSQRRSLIKPVELLIQVVFFLLIDYLVRVLLKVTVFSAKGFIGHLIPANYFVILYIVVYLISPYLNIIFHSFNEKQWDRFILIVFIIFSIWNVVVDFSGEIIGREWYGLSTIGAKGNQSGFNIINFFLLYSIGSYLRLRITPNLNSFRIKAFFAWFICVLLVFFWALACNSFTIFELRSAWVYHNPFVILSSVFLFLVFKSFSFSVPAINNLSKAALTCFLFHIKVMDLIYNYTKTLVEGSSIILIVFLMGLAIGMYLISFVIYTLYSILMNPLVSLIKKIKILNRSMFLDNDA